MLCMAKGAPLHYVLYRGMSHGFGMVGVVTDDPHMAAREVARAVYRARTESPESWGVERVPLAVEHDRLNNTVPYMTTHVFDDDPRLAFWVCTPEISALEAAYLLQELITMTIGGQK